MSISNFRQCGTCQTPGRCNIEARCYGDPWSPPIAATPPPGSYIRSNYDPLTGRSLLSTSAQQDPNTWQEFFNQGREEARKNTNAYEVEEFIRNHLNNAIKNGVKVPSSTTATSFNTDVASAQDLAELKAQNKSLEKRYEGLLKITFYLEERLRKLEEPAEEEIS